jgi:aspartyl protease family protein
MSDMDIAQLMFLSLLGGALVWGLVRNREFGLKKLLTGATSWAVIFAVVIIAAGLWEDIRRHDLPRQSVIASEGRIVVPRSRDGHYYLTLRINDTPVRFVVDTGASDIVLSHSDAERVGLDLADLAYVGRARTANGEVRTAPVRLDTIEAGSIADRNVPAWVNSGDMDDSLLGMSYLQRWDSIEIRGGELVLTRGGPDA